MREGVDMRAAAGTVSVPTSVLTDACVVVPMFNEAGSVVEVVALLRTRFAHVVCVDDGSTDGCGQLAEEVGAHVVRHPTNLGQGAALATGVRYALDVLGSTYVVTFDADGQHDVDDAVAMVRHAKDTGVQVVLGSRFLGGADGISSSRRAVLRAAARFTRVTTGLDVTDAHNGLRVLRADAARQLQLRLHGMSHASEVLSQVAKHRWTYAEHPVTISYTDYSRAKGQRSYNALNIAFDLAFNRIRAAS
jgi:glycosyltransferase involved in cell wall biosynthesis